MRSEIIVSETESVQDQNDIIIDLLHEQNRLLRSITFGMAFIVIAIVIAAVMTLT